MEQLVLYGALIVILLAVIYRSGKRQDGFVRYWSRSFFMRDLNQKMEGTRAADIKKNDGA